MTLQSMKKLKIVFSLINLMFLISCGQQEYVKTTNGTTARQIDSEEITEMCYQGVVYIRFGSPEFSWGSVKYSPDGKIVTCLKENKAQSIIKNNTKEKVIPLK